MLALLIALPFEAVGALMLKHVPRIGVPRDPSIWLRFGGDVAALIHAPWLLLSDFLCVKLCPPNFVLQIITIFGGYLDIAILVLAVATLLRTARSVVSPL
jgi:hypothetical protein